MALQLHSGQSASQKHPYAFVPQTPSSPSAFTISGRVKSLQCPCSFGYGVRGQHSTLPISWRPRVSHVRPCMGTASEGAAGKELAQTALVIVDHGSRRDAANDMLSKVTSLVAPKAGGCSVYAAHMELAEPSISDAFAAAVGNGATHVIVVPFFLSPGRHVMKDIPELAAAAAENHPGVTYDIRPPIGTHPTIADVILERADLPF